MSDAGPRISDFCTGKVDSAFKWLEKQRRVAGITCTPVTFDQALKWEFIDGRLQHRPIGFFSVIGVKAQVCHSEVSIVEQPIISQPEIGILGVMIRRNGEWPELLVQAKAEPGNVHGVQYAPTVQATQSNYARLHGGAPTPYLQNFQGCEKIRYKTDALQSEQGTRFLGKYNRNATVLVKGTGPAPVSEQWRWCDTRSVLHSLREDFRVNTDLRSVLATSDWSTLASDGRPFEGWRGKGGVGEALLGSLAAGENREENSLDDILAFLEEERRKNRISITCKLLQNLNGWSLDGEKIEHRDASSFVIRAFRVFAPHREVADWDQPLVQDPGKGIMVLASQRKNGVLHFLLKTSREIGFLENVQFGPTIQDSPAMGPRKLSAAERRLSELIDSPETTVHLACEMSEEGGRFYRCISRYSLVELSEHEKTPLGTPCCWVTLSQIRDLLRIKGALNNEARSAVSLLLAYLPGPV